MFGLRVDLAVLQMFMGKSSSCIPQFEKVTDDIQGNVLFTIHFGTLANGGFYSFGETLSQCRVIFPYFTIVEKELQVWITGWPVNQNQTNVAVHIHLLALHTVPRHQETQKRKSFAQINFSKLLYYKVTNFQLIQSYGQASIELICNSHYFPATNNRDFKSPTT